MNVHRCVLLTGAGFTHNFGAPLAADVWALFLSHPDVRDHGPVHRLFKENFDFEDVYHEVLSGSFSDQQKTAVLQATRNVFEYIDAIVCRYRLNASAPTHLGVQNLFRSFVGTIGRPGFIFTLNQDLFVERHFSEMARMTPHVPSPWFFQLNSSHAHTAPLFDYQLVLPDHGDFEMPDFSDSAMYYIKLHGSCNWYSQAGSDVMVIGREKKQAIAGNAILQLYLTIFRKVLTEGAEKVLCVGYGFHDEHINDALADGAAAGLRILILGPGSPRDSKEHILKQHRGTEIWEALEAYFPFDLRTLFPPIGSDTPEWRFVATQLGAP